MKKNSENTQPRRRRTKVLRRRPRKSKGNRPRQSNGKKRNFKVKYEARKNEKDLIIKFLNWASAMFRQVAPPRNPSAYPWADVVVCLIYDTFVQMAYQNADSWLKDIKEILESGKIPSPAVVGKIANDKSVTRFLLFLIELTGFLLRGRGKVFAADESKMFYFGTHEKKRWKGRGKKRKKVKIIERNHMSLHVIVEVSTHVIVTASVVDWSESKRQIFIRLLRRAANNHPVEVICGDKDYMRREHVKTAKEEMGILPRFVPKKSHKTGDKKSAGWNENVSAYREGGGVSGEYFRERIQIESTFHMIKTRFTGELSSKRHVSRVNEVLCLVICHNLRVLAEQSLLTRDDASLKPCEPDFNIDVGTLAGPNWLLEEHRADEAAGSAEGGNGGVDA